MKEVTEQQVIEAIREAGVELWPLRECSICRARLHYFFMEDRVEFDSNCDCVSYRTPRALRAYSDVVDLLNRQTPLIRERMWSKMLRGEMA